jgi:hypothetical protein
VKEYELTCGVKSIEKRGQDQYWEITNVGQVSAKHRFIMTEDSGNAYESERNVGLRFEAGEGMDIGR